jgi:hypothetical protein
VARLSRGSDRRGLPHGKEGGLRDYSCTHRDGEGKGERFSKTQNMTIFL